jgi:hypothetical protein
MVPRRLLVLLVLALATSGCRPVSVTSDPRPTYSIDVHNDAGQDMIVSYNDGRGDAVLGTVPPNRSERFIIASPSASTITVRATNASGTRSAGPYTVQLVAGVPQSVRLR